MITIKERLIASVLGLLLGCIAVSFGESPQRNYLHSNPQLNLELDNIYFKFQDIGTSNINDDAITPAKVDEDNTTAFTVKDLIVTNGITCSTLTVNTLYTPGIQVKVSSFTCPAGTGNYSVTGVGFEPRYVEFDIVRISVSAFELGRGAIDYNGNQWSYCCVGSDDAQRSARSASNCVYLIASADGATLVLAHYISMDTDGFTIDFDNVNTVFAIFWKAVR